MTLGYSLINFQIKEKEKKGETRKGIQAITKLRPERCSVKLQQDSPPNHRCKDYCIRELTQIT